VSILYEAKLWPKHILNANVALSLIWVWDPCFRIWSNLIQSQFIPSFRMFIFLTIAKRPLTRHFQVNRTSVLHPITHRQQKTDSINCLQFKKIQLGVLHTWRHTYIKPLHPLKLILVGRFLHCRHCLFVTSFKGDSLNIITFCLQYTNI